jgi:hypothetical protein
MLAPWSLVGVLDPRLKGFKHWGSSLRDKSRSFVKAEGFNPQGCSQFLDGCRAGVADETG